MDVFSRSKRSEIMSRVKGKDTRPEKIVRTLLHAMGFRFRLHRRDLPGCPDIVLPRHNRIILVHGCFWHGHTRCRKKKLPQTNADFWRDKISANVKRDRTAARELRSLGWSLLVIWECETRDYERLKSRLTKFLMT